MKKPVQLLMVEDSDDDATLIIHALDQGGFEPSYTRVQTAAGLASALDSKPWDLVTSDHRMPGFSSLEALELFKGRQLDIPFVLVSGAIGEDEAVKVMKAGASDYVMKDHLGQLAAVVDRALQDALHRRARRRAEEALARNQQELADFFEHASVGLHWEGPDGMILRVNQAELDILGYGRQDYLGHKFEEFCVDPGAAEEILARLHQGETLNNHEVRLRAQDGSIKHVLLNANVYTERGKFIHSRCFMRDITEHKRGEEAMAYLAAIVDSSEDAIIGTTPDGVVLSWNAGAERMYGYSAEEAKGRRISFLVPPSRPDELPGIYERIRAGGRVERLETVRQRKDGAGIEVALTLSPIRNARGEVIGVSAIEADITERKREEQERFNLIEELTGALAKIKTLRGLLPICASCKKIRDDGGYWQKVESYISAHTEAEFTHGICPECLVRLYPDYANAASGRN